MRRIRSWIKAAWDKTRRHPLGFTIVVALLVVILLIIWSLYLHFAKGYTWADWTGFGNYTGPLTKDQRGKTLWDWLGLLFIPAVFAIAAYLFNASQKRRDESLSYDRQRESVLQDYFDTMGKLLTEKDLLRTENDESSPVRSYAQVLTTTALRSLDKNRRNILCQFLRDSKLGGFILKKASLGGCFLSGTFLDHLDLSEADLTNAHLNGANLNWAKLRSTSAKEIDLRGAQLRFAHLNNADLPGAYLNQADLSYVDMGGNTNMTGADLTEAILSHSIMSGVDLTHAIMSGADLYKTNLSGAHLGKTILHRANMKETILEIADLRKADLTGASVLEDQLKQAKSLAEATMPDGSKHP